MKSTGVERGLGRLITNGRETPQVLRSESITPQTRHPMHWGPTLGREASVTSD